MEGTSIKLPDKLQSLYPGSVGVGVKFQMEFDLLTGKLTLVEIQSGKSADSASGMKRLETLEKHDLILQDLGCFQSDLFEMEDKEKAFYVSRAKADTMFYQDHPNPRYHKNGDIIKNTHMKDFFSKRN